MTLIAAGIDVGYLLLFLWLGSPLMSLINLASIGMYTAAFHLIGRRHNRSALLLIWAEVLVHAALGSLLLGWDSGFHYYLLLFIPAIVIANTRGYAVPMVGGLLAYYLGLKVLCDHLGALMPLPGNGMVILFWIHVCIVFAMSASISAFYRRSILVAEHRLVKQASTDPLTGLATRTHFQALAAAALARCRREARPVALMIGDIDHFKSVNDQHGHERGDQVLVHVAALLAAGLRDGDALARWGGEEFVALLPDCPAERAVAVAQRLRTAIAGSPLEVSGARLAVTMSIGLTQVEAGDTLETALQRADRALYESKHQGRDRVTLG